MAAIGFDITDVTEDTNLRPPGVRETADLAIPAGVRVLVIQRTFFAAELPVATSDIVVPADRYRLVYRIPVDG